MARSPSLYWSRVRHVLRPSGDLSGKLILICSFPLNAADTKLVVSGISSGAEQLATAGLIRDLVFDPVDAGPPG